MEFWEVKSRRRNYYILLNGKTGDIIENPGFVGNIPSSKEVNTIGTNLDNKKKI